MIIKNKHPEAVSLLAQSIRLRNWENGNSYNNKLRDLFLRAASLGFTQAEAIKCAAEAIEHFKVQVPTKDVLRQCERAYVRVGGIPEALDGKNCSYKCNKLEALSFNPEVLNSTIEGVPALTYSELRSLSPFWVTTPGAYISSLYNDDDTVFVSDSLHGKDIQQMETESILSFDSDEGGFFLCNPITGHKEERSDLSGGYSYRSEGCIASFKYMLLESDEVAYSEQWLKFLVTLELPIVSIVSSGGKSLHSLIRVDASSKEEWVAFRNEHLEHLVTHGADRAAMSLVRLTRLPFCNRGNTGKLQELIYLNPDANGSTILSLKEGGVK